MEQYVIIEKLKETIDGKKVKAALFYSFGFDARFFENYVLPSFLPHVNFSDNEIQNAILWRKYIKELPPVTVYCDFHAKMDKAPELSYEVRTVDLPAEGGEKACYHPKLSLILLEDETLVVIAGSNNLTKGGWCTNREIVAFKKLKNNEYWPNEQKKELEAFFNASLQLFNPKTSIAEELIRATFTKRLHTNHNDFQFYSSFKEPFKNFLMRILETEGEEKFERIEVISPYLTTGINLVNELIKLSTNNTIHMNVPYMATNEADITEKNYRLFEQNGVKWSKLSIEESEKTFRFNHSKVYRLKTSNKLFTVVGSVNFTDAAWRGRNAMGNIETAVLFEETCDAWQPWLKEYFNKDIRFALEQKDETKTEKRLDVPDFGFTLDWQNKTLRYTNFKKFNFTGQIRFRNRNIELKIGSQEIVLDEQLLNSLVEDSTIKVWQYHEKRELLYYPIQIGFDFKPMPVKLKLNDNELIKLWEHVSIKSKTKNEIADLIERFIMQRQNIEGELLKEETPSKSTLNLMASHISALIHLEERIFDVPKLKGDYQKAIEVADYYLFMTNIDRLKGYRNLLFEMYHEKSLLPGVYWFLLNILLKNFYNKNKIRRFYESTNHTNEQLNNQLKVIITEIEEQASKLKAEMQGRRISNDLFNWIIKEL